MPIVPVIGSPPKSTSSKKTAAGTEQLFGSHASQSSDISRATRMVHRRFGLLCDSARPECRPELTFFGSSNVREWARQRSFSDSSRAFQ